MFNNFYSLFEVEGLGKIKRVDFIDQDGEKCNYPEAQLELKRPGRFSVDHLTATLWGKAALHPFKKGDLVAVQLRFGGYRKGDDFINDIVIDDIKLMKDLDRQYL